MSKLKNQLIRLGNTNPSLRKHIKPVLTSLGKEAGLTQDSAALLIAKEDLEKIGAWGWGLEEEVEMALGLNADEIEIRKASFSPDPRKSGYTDKGWYMLSGKWTLTIGAKSGSVTLLGDVEIAPWATESFGRDATRKLIAIAPEGWKSSY